MIEKDFVPDEIAMQMFELGFDEKCVKFKWNDQDKSKWMGATNRPTSFHTQKLWSENDDSYTISIPTFSQCFRWFREKGIENEIHSDSDRMLGYNRGYIPVVQFIVFYNNGDCYETYEEAEKACLKKLIEIVKLNNQ